jgi:hypothetical protein
VLEAPENRSTWRTWEAEILPDLLAEILRIEMRKDARTRKRWSRCGNGNPGLL